MYLGLSIALFGAAFKWGSIFGFLVIPLFIWYMNRFQIQPEEEMMGEKFGEEFTFYKREVRRWV
jgi:protein-S-isoprenylcysteine O-methyltransferase Ste14